jgi:Papain family cysteine protease
MMRPALLSLFLACGASGIAEAQGGTPLPSHVDLRPAFEGEGLACTAQGDRDTCSLFAITAVAEFESGGGRDMPHPPLSEEFAIWAAKKATGKTHDQAMFYEATRGLNVLGICRADLMHYVEKPKPAEKPSPRALSDARTRSERWHVHWIRRWNVNRPLNDGELTAIKHALAHRHPVACGMRWPKSMKGNQILAVPGKDQVFDGHSVALVGYDDDARKPGGGAFRFRNSNGPGWGDHGYGVISYGYVRAYANDAIWLQQGPPHSEVPIERFEAERLPIVAREGAETSVQSMDDWERALWSQGKQLYVTAKRNGFVELRFNVRKPDHYRVRVLATAAPDYGTIHVRLDGKPVGPSFDLYSGRVCPSGSLELGTHEISGGEHRIRFTSVGKDHVSGNFNFGLDAIDLLLAE